MFVVEVEDAVDEAIKIWLTAAFERGGLGGLVILVAGYPMVPLLEEPASFANDELLWSFLDGFTIFVDDILFIKYLSSSQSSSSSFSCLI